MGQYNRAIITTAGENLIARAIVGEIQLNITKAKTSDHKYPDSTYFKDLTDMQGIKQVITSPETKVLSGDLIQTRTLFSNEEVTSTYYIQNIGLYAMDGTHEVLFCIVTAATPDEMPLYNGVASTSYIYNIQNAVQDAAEINIEVVPSGTATIQDVMERVDATGGDISETVIETLEPIDTKYPIPAAGETTKVFMGKVKKYIEDTKPLDANMTIYVAATGNNTTGDGTSAKPYRTIQYALNILPKDLGSLTASVIIANGTYDENLDIYGFINGKLLIRSNTESVDNSVIIKSIHAFHCACDLWIQGVTIAETTSQNAIIADVVKSLTINYTSITNSNLLKTCILAWESIIHVANSRLSNHAHAIYAGQNCNIYSNSNTGSGNNIGICSTAGGKISCSGTQPTGIRDTTTATGGVIFQSNGTQISGLITSGLSCTWGTISGGYVRHGNLNGVAMVTIQMGVKTTITLNPGSYYKISGFPLPVGGNTAVTATAQAWVENCWLDASNGTINYLPRSELSSSLYTILFNVTYLTNS